MRLETDAAVEYAPTRVPTKSFSVVCFVFGARVVNLYGDQQT